MPFPLPMWLIDGTAECGRIVTAHGRSRPPSTTMDRSSSGLSVELSMSVLSAELTPMLVPCTIVDSQFCSPFRTPSSVRVLSLLDIYYGCTAAGDS